MTAISPLLRFTNVAQFKSDWDIRAFPNCLESRLGGGEPFEVRGHRFFVARCNGRYDVRDLKADSFFSAIRQFFTAFGRAATRRQLQTIVDPPHRGPSLISIGNTSIGKAGITAREYPAVGFKGGMSLSTGGTAAERQPSSEPHRADGVLTILPRYQAEPQRLLYEDSSPCRQPLHPAPSAPPYEGSFLSRQDLHRIPSAPPYEYGFPSQPAAARAPAIVEEGRLYPSLHEYGFEYEPACVGNAGWLPGCGPSS